VGELVADLYTQSGVRSGSVKLKGRRRRDCYQEGLTISPRQAKLFPVALSFAVQMDAFHLVR
jgi:hypothetical protein